MVDNDTRGYRLFESMRRAAPGLGVRSVSITPRPTFGSRHIEVWGRCGTHDDGTSDIWILSSLPNSLKAAVLAHELGHHLSHDVSVLTAQAFGRRARSKPSAVSEELADQVAELVTSSYDVTYRNYREDHMKILTHEERNKFYPLVVEAARETAATIRDALGFEARAWIVGLTPVTINDII